MKAMVELERSREARVYEGARANVLLTALTGVLRTPKFSICTAPQNASIKAMNPVRNRDNPFKWDPQSGIPTVDIITRPLKRARRANTMRD